MRSFRALCHDQRAARYPPTQMARPSFPTPPPGRFQGSPRKQIDFVWQGSVHAAPLERKEATTAHPPTAFRTSASKSKPGNPYVSAIHLSALLLRAIFRQLCINIFFGKDTQIHLHWARLRTLGLICIHI